MTPTLSLEACTDVLTVAQLAAVLGFHRRTIIRHLMRGDFPIPVLDNLITGQRRHYRWSKLAVAAYLRHQASSHEEQKTPV
jgi:predicted DNA-binding transcriptional regulator AlpA